MAGTRHEAEQVAAADTLYIYRGESNRHLQTPRPGAETDCQQRFAETRTHPHPLLFLVPAGGGRGLELEAEEADSSGHERTSALEDD